MFGWSGSEILNGVFGLIVLFLGAWCRAQEDRIKDLEAFNTAVYKHWEDDAKNYVTKADFNDFTKDIKESLNRIEDKVEKLRSV